MAGEATLRRVGTVYESNRELGVTTSRGLYEALAPLTCARCRGAIAGGERYTRRRSSAVGGQAPVCRACAPFEEVGG